MNCTKIQIFFVMIITSILLPLCVILGIALIKTNHIHLIVYLSLCMVAYLILYILYKSNPWEFTFQRLKLPPIILVTLVIITGLYRRGFSLSINQYDCWIEVINLLMIYTLCRIICKIHKASKKPDNVLEIQFPFENGKYLITDGGDGYISALMNYHYKSSTHNQHRTQASMRYAVDIAKLGTWGRTIARIIVCSKNADYAIFHEAIHSPIDGIVVKVQDGVNNNQPFPGKGKLPYNLGNFIVIKSVDYYIIMGHMEKESIMVREGDNIHIGDKIGMIGNSGLTPRPHLHIQVSRCTDGDYWAAEGVPIVFNQKFYPVKNRVIKV